MKSRRETVEGRGCSRLEIRKTSLSAPKQQQTTTISATTNKQIIRSRPRCPNFIPADLDRGRMCRHTFQPSSVGAHSLSAPTSTAQSLMAKNLLSIHVVSLSFSLETAVKLGSDYMLSLVPFARVSGRRGRRRPSSALDYLFLLFRSNDHTSGGGNPFGRAIESFSSRLLCESSVGCRTGKGGRGPLSRKHSS